MAWFIILLLVGAAFGAVGILIAQNKGVSSAAGFWLGALLGPIGLIVVALLSEPDDPKSSNLAPGVPRERARTAVAEFEGERDLQNDAYKLWLTARYDMHKNEVLGSFVCKKRLFPDIQAALEFANEQEQARLAAARHDELRKQEELAAHRRVEAEREQERKDALRRWAPYLLLAGGLAAIGIGYALYQQISKQIEQAAAERRKADAQQRAHSEQISNANKILANYGFQIGPEAEHPEIHEPGEKEYETFCKFDTQIGGDFDGSSLSHRISGAEVEYSLGGGDQASIEFQSDIARQGWVPTQDQFSIFERGDPGLTKFLYEKPSTPFRLYSSLTRLDKIADLNSDDDMTYVDVCVGRMSTLKP